MLTWRFSLEEVISDKGETSFTIPITSDEEFKDRTTPKKNDLPHRESLLISCRALSGTKLYLIVGTFVTSWHYKFKFSTGQKDNPKKLDDNRTNSLLPLPYCAQNSARNHY